MAHTLFNVTNVIVLAFFIPLLARLCEKLIPSKEESRACVLEPHLLVTPELALHAARLALADMTRRAWTVAAAALASAIGKTKVVGVGGLISQVRAFANVVAAALRKGEPMTIDPAAADSEIKNRARLISHSDGVPLELLSLLAAVRDITRHLGNIATRVNGI